MESSSILTLDELYLKIIGYPTHLTVEFLNIHQRQIASVRPRMSIEAHYYYYDYYEQMMKRMEISARLETDNFKYNLAV